MPRTLSFPPPSTATCPICSSPLSDPHCERCGASFAGADGATLWRVDHDLFDLCRIRNDLVHRLLTPEAALAPAHPAPTGWGRTTPTPAPEPASAGRASAGHPGRQPVPAVSASASQTSPAASRSTGSRAAGPMASPPEPHPASAHAASPSTPSGPAGPLESPPATAAGPSSASSPPARIAPTVGAAPAPASELIGPATRPAGATMPTPAERAGDLSPWGSPAATTGSAPLAPAARRESAPAPAWATTAQAPSGGFLGEVWSPRPAPAGAWSGAGPDDGAGQPPSGPPWSRPSRPSRPRPSFSAAEVLVGLGALSLVAAVAVFAAVSWSDLAAWAQGALIVTLTGAVLGAAVACRRRDLVATSESLGAVGVALGLADVQVARVGLDGLAHGRTVWAAGLAVVAAGALALGRRTKIRVLGLAGGALAFAPLVVAAAGGRPLTWIGALAVQAVVGGVVAARLADHRLERVVAVVGATVSWAGAVLAALVLAGTGLMADPIAQPLGPVLVLASLAAATIVGARRLPVDEPAADVVAGAGAALALVPALLLAVGQGSMLGVLTAAVGQSVLALALAMSGRASRGERAVLTVGGATSWAGSATGLVALALAWLADGDSATGPLAVGLVLAGLALCSLAVARARPTDLLATPLAGAGAALAFVPAPLIAAGTGSILTVLAVVAAQAVVALGLAATGRLSAPERASASAGGTICWLGAAIGGVLLGGEQALDGAARTSPVGAALVLAALAGCSIILARLARTDDLAGPIGTAASALALVPALLVATGAGSILTVLTVVAVQAIVALALAGWVDADGAARLTPSERAVAVVGGWVLWATGAIGSLLLAVVEIADAYDDPDGRIRPLLLLSALAASAIVIGRLTRRIELVAAGAAVAFLPVPLAVLGLTTPTVLLAILLGEVLIAAVLATLVDRGPVRAVLVTGGVTTWLVALIGSGLLGLAGWLGTPESGPAGSIALLVALAALALGASLRSGWDPTGTGVGLGAAVVPLLLAAGLAAAGLGLDGWVAAVLAAAAVLAIGAGVLARIDGERPWVAPSGVALIAGAGLAVVPVRYVIAVVAALVDRAATTPDVGGGIVLADWLRPAFSSAPVAVPGWAVVAQLVGAAGVAGAAALLHRRTGRVLGTMLGVGGLVVVPVAAGLTVGVTTAGLGLVVLAAAAVIRLRPRDPELLAGATATVLLGTAVALGSAPWMVGWSVLVGLVVAGLAVLAVVRRSPDVPAWVGAAVGVVLTGVALDAWVLGATGTDGLLAVAIAAAALSPAAALLERRGADVAADLVDALVGVAVIATPLIGIAVTSTVLSLSPFAAVIGVTAAGAALRPRRRPAWLLATASAVVLVWLQAGRAEVDLVEAYSVPLAAWALLVGAVAGKGRGSWERYGLGLLAAAGPTTALALVDPDPLRTIAVVAVGAAIAVWGAAARLQAPLAIGAGAVGILALRHLGPVSVDLPRYVTFAVAGLVLLVVGATFEQRRQDLRQARDAFTRLG